MSTPTIFTIPPAKRAQMQQQAQAAQMPYATVVGQHVYDLQGLVQVLTDALATATKQAADPTAAADAHAAAIKQVADLAHKLAARQAELAAYQREQAGA